jgi:hypothetical protein
MEMRTRLNNKGSDNQAGGLFVKGCSEILLILEVDPMRRIQVKLNQEVDRSPS